jgi:DNA-binding SARP family transcriptional activator
MGRLDIRFLGQFKLLRNEQELPLPPSRKTRALLAWLSLHRRRYSREQLCELLWELPDDPKGSLRWSLSKLRRLLDEDDRRRIIADRTGVEIDVSDVSIDVYELGSLARNVPERAVAHARALVDIAPYDEPSRATLIRLLHSLRHVEEANQQYQLGLRMLKEAGICSTGALLSALRGADTQHAPVPGPASQGPATEAVPQGMDLIGRASEQRQLEDALAAATGTGSAEVLLVLGEPGIGKSRMLEHASQRAREAGACLLEARAYESERVRPFALWIDALRAADREAAKRVFCDAEAPNRERLFSALSELVGDESARRPVVLVFDDVQWCDESSAAALHYVVRTNRNRPLIGVIAARDGELEDNIPVQQTLSGLRSAGLVNELKLHPLSDASAAQLIAAHAPDADAERLSRHCGGNPLFAIELARAGADGAGAAPLNQLVRERLARLDVNGAEILRWAALLGPRIDVATLVRLTGVDPAEVAAILETGERQAILASAEQGLQFSHELIARAVYADISPVRRQVMHHRIAELMEQDTALDPSQASELAYHATQSGDPKLAARAMVSAGQLCLRFFANCEALSLARKGLELADALSAAERVRVAIELHEIICAAAPLEDWEAAARRYAALAEEALDHGALGHARRGYHLAAYVRWQHGHFSGAREQSLQSERAARGGSEENHIIGMAETAKCLVLIERDLSQADAMLMEAEARAERRRFRYHAIPAAMGMLRFYENRLDEAEELLREARTQCKCAGDRINEYQANEYLVMIAIQRGSFDEARRHCRDLLSLGKKLREGSEYPFARALHGLCDYALQDDDAALDAALEDLRIADAKHRLAYVLTRAALLDYERGRIEPALRRATEALGHAELLQRSSEMLLAHVVLGLGLEAVGDSTEARGHAAKVTALEAAGVAAWAKNMADSLGPALGRQRTMTHA